MESSYSYTEPPLPTALQDEIESSVARFKDMWPGFLSQVAEEYAPRYRAEITTVSRKAYRYGVIETRIDLAQSVGGPRPETPKI